MSEFPFLFYGSRPGDWYEGANSGHFYELRFREPPSAETRAQIGAAFAAGTQIGIVEGGRWLWSGAWALVIVGERRTGNLGAFFDKIEALMHTVHAIAPLAEVVFWGARAPTKAAWETWTLAQQARPSSGPVYPRLRAPDFYGQGRDATLATPAPDPACDRAVAAVPPPPPSAPAPEPAEIDPSRPATLAEAVARAEAFLDAYTLRDEYFIDEVPVLSISVVAANARATAIQIMFSVDDEDDPTRTALCAKAIAALGRAHPNLTFPVEWSV